MAPRKLTEAKKARTSHLLRQNHRARLKADTARRGSTAPHGAARRRPQTCGWTGKVERGTSAISTMTAHQSRKAVRRERAGQALVGLHRDPERAVHGQNRKRR